MFGNLYYMSENPSMLTFTHFATLPFFLHLFTQWAVQVRAIMVGILSGTTNSSIITTAFDTTFWSVRRSM